MDAKLIPQNRLIASHLSNENQVACRKVFFLIKRSLTGLTPVQASLEASDVHPAPWLSRDSEDLGEFRKIIAQRRHNSHVKFEDRTAFALYDDLFFYRNLYKCLIASAFILQHSPRAGQLEHVDDLGCGSGTFGIAWSLLVRELSGTHVSIRFVDRYSFQLLIALNTVHRLGLYDQSSFVVGDLFEHLMQAPQRVTLASYSLFNESDYKLPFTRRATRDGELHLLAIDYERNIRAAAEQFSNLGFKVQDARVGGDVQPNMIRDVRSVSVKANLLYAFRD
ncbi:hypothetical protein [Mesorhizobium sp. 128a]